MGIILREDPTASPLQFADDTHIHVEPDKSTEAHDAVSAEWAKAGFGLNVTMAEVWTPNPAVGLGEWEGRRVASLKCLGAFLEDDGIAWASHGFGERLAKSSGGRL